jgi:hypothetical protein
MAMRKLAGVLAGILVAIAVGQASAGVLFDGNELRYQYRRPTLSTLDGASNDFWVGSAVEQHYVDGTTQDPYGFHVDLDVSDTNIRVDFSQVGYSGTFAAVAFNGFSLSDKNGSIPDIISVEINSETNMVGFNSSRVTWNSNEIYVNWQGLDFGPTVVVSLDVEGPVPQPGDGTVPEPATLAIWSLLAGVGAMVGWRRRKRAA